MGRSSRRMSALEEAFREAVCPATLPEAPDADSDPTKATLGDYFLVDGMSSVRRLSSVKNLTRALSMRKSSDDLNSLRLESARIDAESARIDAESARVDDLTRRPSVLPPPPPPPVEQTDEVEAAVQAAAQRRASVSGAPA